MKEKPPQRWERLENLVDDVLADSLPKGLQDALADLVNKGATDEQILLLVDRAVAEMRGQSNGLTRSAVVAFLQRERKSGTKTAEPLPAPPPIAAELPALSPSKRSKS